MYYWQFSKNILSPKMAAILNFQTFAKNEKKHNFLSISLTYLFIYLGFYVDFNSVQVISRRVVGRAEETSTYSSLGFCTVNCQPTASNYQLSHLRPFWGSNPASEVGGESVTTLSPWCAKNGKTQICFYLLNHAR